ncbi:MAG: hypothetical protein CM15mL5_0710 [uncultured marine virus]|nr:MAG: hypothetical protein CM15mL5_0710 [uncultured marine virus]
MNIFLERKEWKTKGGNICSFETLVFMVDGDEIVSFEPDQKSDYDEHLLVCRKYES